MAGNVDAAIQKTKELYPGVLQPSSKILFDLQCRKFVEMIADGIGEKGSSDTMNADAIQQEDVEMEYAEMEDEIDRIQQALVYGQELQDEYRDDERVEIQQTLMV
jgi:hypothetical protein